jgi:hypothetical protein
VASGFAALGALVGFGGSGFAAFAVDDLPFDPTCEVPFDDEVPFDELPVFDAADTP